jgi:signal transduction histidine kinase/ActR/RegA family two-component response regulator
MRLSIGIAAIGLFVVLYSCESENVISFSAEEKVWLSENPSITLAVDDTYPPLNYLNKSGQIVGLNIDLVNLIGNKLGIDIVLEGSSWSAAIEKAMKHEVDGIINATALNERRARLVFTESITQDPQALICDKSLKGASSFSDFQDKRVAAKKNSRQLVLLKSRIPEKNIVVIETLFEGFDLLSRAKIDAIYDDFAPLYYIITSMNLNNISIALIENNGDGSTIGLRNNDPILLSVMNKAINSISMSEKSRIYDKWFQLRIHDYRKYYVVIGILFLSAILFFVWNRMLKLVVKNKTKILVSELAERKKIEEELFIAKEKAEESDRLKSAFLANMSHEIRTPMNGIIGFAELLSDLSINNELKKKYARIVIDSGDQLLSIVNDILDISRIEAEKVEVVKAIINVNSLIDELFEFFVLKTNRKGINLLKEKGLSDIDSYLYTDKVKLKQVLSNLISNAIKFTKEGYIKIGYSIDKDKMKFFVEDTGIGINSDIQTKIFERFRQAELDVTRQYGGTGLGLSISEKLSELLGGKIWVESETGKGSIFYFKVPFDNIRTNSGKKIEEKENCSNCIKGTKILVVEDEEINYLYLLEILKDTGTILLHANNGKEAIDLCATHPEIDIVLMDIKMPVVNGYDATREIKKHRPDLPIIAQTAYALYGDQEKAFKAGCDDYITKPLIKDTLIYKINKHLNFSDKAM